MSEHTPGPWRVQRALAHSDLHIRSEVPNDDLYDIAVLSAKKPTGFPPDTVEANARVMAAAPELLDALRDVIDELRAIKDLEVTVSAATAIMRASIAVKEAEGS